VSEHLYAVVPAGGAGTRLWPRSRRALPKHLLPLSGTGKPLVKEAWERVKPLAQQVFVLTEERQAEVIRQLLPELGPEALIVEPVARGTTNALGLAAMTLLDHDPEAVMVSTAADHVIRGLPAFHDAIRRAAALAERARWLVTIGLQPRYPATGFGYIEVGDEVEFDGLQALAVRGFVEKPDEETARRYVEGGRHLWNLNLFCWRCDVFLEELRRHGPDHHDGLRDVLAARRAGNERLAAERYARLPVEAVDYTVMERTDRLLVVPAGFEWRDVGSWSELADLLQQDEAGNVVEGPTILLDSRDCFVSAPDKLVAVIGMEGVVVVDTADALLVCPRTRSQDVKRVVEQLERLGKTEYL
jgi:mannose-1-phosphate guanylyltransferase